MTLIRSTLFRPRFAAGVLSLVAAVAGCRHASAPTPVAEARPSAVSGPGASDPFEIEWLRQHAMLSRADELVAPLAGSGDQWQHPYGVARPGDFLDLASVWFNAYPGSLITRPEESVLEGLGDPVLLAALERVGVRAIHTGPLKRGGSVEAMRYGPSIDGYFDRIELAIDPAFGNEGQYRDLVRLGRAHGISIIGDIIPGHTGMGPDFRLAERAVPGFPELYTMSEIRREDWALLPDVPDGQDSVNLSPETARRLEGRGYIVGPLDAVIFARPGIKESNWSATDVVRGADGRERRWVYLHLFKRGQPTLNWLDPSFAAQRLVAGDVVYSLRSLGARGLRLDANMFLGFEPRGGDEPGWLLEHPLSTLATETLAMLIRKMGGFSFQELNVSLDRVGATLASGPELAYDFTTRPAYLYALATGDAGPLRLMLRAMLQAGVRPIRMVHALQNHDELMLETTHLRVHASDTFEYEGESATGADLFRQMYERPIALTTGGRGPYNERFAMSPGVCSTLAGFTAASLGKADLDHVTPDDVARIRARHLAAAAYNALQPGAFVVSGWDLVGALPVARDLVRDRLADNDCRWLNRGAYDLVDAAPAARASALGLPRAVALYGSIVEQLENPVSFSSTLARMLALRRRLGIDRGKLVAVPPVDARGLALLVVEIAGEAPGAGRRLALCAVNFGHEAVEQTLSDRTLPPGSASVLFSSLGGPVPRAAERSEDHWRIRLAASEAQLLLVEPAVTH